MNSTPFLMKKTTPFLMKKNGRLNAPQPARGVEPDEKQTGLPINTICRDFGHSDGKHAFDAPRDQRLYRLKPSYNGPSVPAKSGHGIALRRMELFHS
jgi:hypothetical protein